MRSTLFLALFAVVASRGDCSPHKPVYDPCAAKACGDSCRLCPPDARDCVETAVVKACDPAGICTAAGTFTCEQPPAYDPCAGKAQCDACTLCPPDATDCVETAVLKECDAAGQCVESTGQCTPSPYDPCAGLRCGDSCSPCPPPQVCPTFAATACNAAGECATVGTFTCAPPPPPADPCAGKQCGDDCTIEPPCAPLCMMPTILGKCDAASVCQPVRVVQCAPPPPPADPCAGKLCGDVCNTCDPTMGVCPAVMMYCDVAGACGYAYPVCN